MNCPQCLAHPMGDIWAASDKLWCEFEAEVIDGYLHTVYWCRQCDFAEQKKFDPEELHRGEVDESSTD